MPNAIDPYLGFDTTPVQRFARPETIYFWWAKAPAVVFWAASYFKNGVYAYGEREDQLLDRIARVSKLATVKFQEPELSKSVTRPRRRAMRETGFRDHSEVVFYDLTKTHSEYAKELQKTNRNFIYRAPDSIETLLAKLQQFRQSVKEAYSQSPYGAHRRTGVLMFLLLDEKATSVLKNDPKAMAELLDVFEHAHDERLYPIICVKEAPDLSASIVKASESSIFLGEINESLAQAFYKVEVQDQEYGAVKIGMAWDTTKPDVLRRIAAVKLEKKQWVIDRQAAMKQQDADWKAYLEALEEQRT